MNFPPQAEAYEYMVDYLDSTKVVGRPENVVGWYHSHPGYGCWLSGEGLRGRGRLYESLV